MIPTWRPKQNEIVRKVLNFDGYTDKEAVNSASKSCETMQGLKSSIGDKCMIKLPRWRRTEIKTNRQVGKIDKFRSHPSLI